MTGTLAGTVLDGRWSLTARIASGSFASVYRALDLETGKERAVKILTEVATPEAVQRFRAEFETLRRMTHPHVVGSHAVGTVEGRPYMVLDLVSGGNVTVLLDDGPIDAERACVIGVQVLAGLAEAHARGVVHRDVKPGNVLVDDRGGALVCDFGIARIESADQVRLTQVGASLGTLLYMSPEQRLDAHAVDLTADLYGVGCLLYRLVTDESPADLFSAAPGSARWAAVPEVLRPVLIRATRGLPEDRYPDARAMAEALLAALPAERRAEVEAMPGCDPLRFPVPDPNVRVGTFADEATVPGEPRVPPRKKPAPPPAARPAPGVAKRARRAPSPWPWRIGVAVFAVVVIGVVGMMLGGCAG